MNEICNECRKYIPYKIVKCPFLIDDRSCFFGNNHGIGFITFLDDFSYKYSWNGFKFFTDIIKLISLEE